MSESREHRETAIYIANKFGVEYNSGRGADVISPLCVVEVETPGTVYDGVRQLQGYRGKVYIAGTNQKAVRIAMVATYNTTIGVMDNRGNIVKCSTRAL